MTYKLPSAREKLDRIRKGTLTPSENVKTAFKIISERNASLNALCYVAKEKAIKDAATLEASSKAASCRLFGLTFSAKDHFLIKGMPASEGSIQTAIKSSDSTEPIIHLLENEGAICIGKGNMPEFGKSNFTDNLIYGRTSNPWNEAYTCGGSTGGDAVSVATGMSDFGLGGDSGGSLRVPANFCGLFGILPSRGLIKRSPSPFILNSFLKLMGSTGVVTRTLDDLELIYELLIGSSLLQPTNEAPRLKKNLTFAVLRQVAGVGATPDIDSLLTKTAERFSNLGYTEVSVDNSIFDSSVPVFIILAGQAGLLQEDLMRAALKDPRDHSKETPTLQKLRSEMQTLLPPLTVEGLLTHIYTWEDLKRKANDLFNTVDFILAPVAATPPLKHGTHTVNLNGVDLSTHHLFHFSRAANALDLPALAFPLGFNQDNLPLGLQVMTKSGHDRFLFQLLRNIEK